MGEQPLKTGAKRVREVRAATVAIAFLLLCLAVFAGSFAFFLTGAVNQTRLRIEERSHAAAQVIATNAGWMEQVAMQTLRRVDAAIGTAISGDSTGIQAAVEGLPQQVDVYIIDADANTIFTTVPDTPSINVADREYFITLRDGAPFYTSGMLESRLTGERLFVFSKRVQRQGQFAGAIIVSFTDELLHEFWSSLDLEDGSTVSLIRRDGELMARYPAVQEPQSLAEHVLITTYLPAEEAGTYYSPVSPLDGIARVVSYRAVPGTQILALAAIASDRAWKSVNEAVFAVVIIAAPIVLGLIAGGIFVVRLLGRDARRRSELEEANETNVLLFREIHHRVKNNLQSVQSLVRMQDMPRGAKIDLQSRLSAMAAMHEHIYKHDRYEDIDAHDLIPVVVNEVIHAYGTGTKIQYAIDHVAIDRDHITPLSLLLSELVTNALKYAFTDGREGVLEIIVRDKGQGRCVLIVADNGVGMDELPENPTSMGLRLIRGVVSQMGGEHRFTSDNGMRFEADIALVNAGHAISPEMTNA